MNYYMIELLHDRDMKLWNGVTTTDTVLSNLLPPYRNRRLRDRTHNYILPRVRASRFKSIFINRCLFKYL